MVQGCSLFVTENEITLASIVSDRDFLVDELCWATGEQTDESLYQQIVYKVLTNPKRLIAHMQRIYFTYSREMVDPLYAALADFFWVLDGRGKRLAARMLSATRSLLTEHQSEMLVDYLEHKNTALLQGNGFSVLTKGIEGSGILLSEQDREDTAHDPLVIARDYIEYSQLDAAMETLETAVLENPEREELQADLLELYKVTKNDQAFSELRDLLVEKKLDLSVEWQELTDYFAGLTNED